MSEITFSVTGYCPCNKCSQGYGRKTASGRTATARHTIAASKKYPFGTQIELDGYGVFVVEDRGGKVQGNVLDIFFDTHQEALNWGRRTCTGRIIG